MDSDLCASRIAAAKRQYSLQHHLGSQLDRLSTDDVGMEEEVRPDFPCPYCYEDHDIASLCSHLEDEHPFESKVTRRRRTRRTGIPSNQPLSLLARDLREAHLQVLLGSGGFRSSSSHASNVVTDPFLSSLVLNFPAAEVEELSKSVVSAVEDTYARTMCLSSHLFYQLAKSHILVYTNEFVCPW
ncbi:hypothetical protein Taro_026268 [Colocasia esculenta]|uniref:Drought induced 19 protein type zinc-binding domain-containing protein n=1 Tax=Colocasia esculenta TaxID=4460 RepID=A0A843VAZ4_COLES|nr:hypothetical protein [Colocasia esculenta]